MYRALRRLTRSRFGSGSSILAPRAAGSSEIGYGGASRTRVLLQSIDDGSRNASFTSLASMKVERTDALNGGPDLETPIAL
jgi:hypothetical protein